MKVKERGGLPDSAEPGVDLRAANAVREGRRIVSGPDLESTLEQTDGEGWPAGRAQIIRRGGQTIRGDRAAVTRAHDDDAISRPQLGDRRREIRQDRVSLSTFPRRLRVHLGELTTSDDRSRRKKTAAASLTD